MTSAPVPYGTRIHQVAQENPNQVAIYFLAEDGSERQVTWRELDERSTQLARALAKRGLGIGDRFAIKLRNCPEHYFASFAGWKLGAVVTPMRWDLPEWEVERVRAVLDAKVTLEPSDPAIEASKSESTEPLADAIAPFAQGLLSSGSTGTPKIILRTVPAMFDPSRSANALVEHYGLLSKPQLLVVPAPLYHTNGFMSTGHLMHGDRLILLERFNSTRILEAVQKYRSTGFIATTVMLQRLARDPAIDATDLSSIEWVMHGAAPLPDWLARRWIELLGPKKFFVCYGSSEGLGATFANGEEYLDHPGTVGKPAVGTSIRILDTDGNDLPTGEVGSIYMRADYGVVARYVGDAPPLPVTDDGFGSVGDMGRLDDEGFLHLADRRVDMIISGGSNVFPAEVESALSEHPAVADAVVIGLADPEWGQRVHAIVQRAPGVELHEADLIAYAKARLAPYKVPKAVEFVDVIPRSEATKLNRAKLVADRQS